ncbi:NAD(P)/FAD-dependent oxidoreductase [Alkalibacter rhizosphaerae]|uniref:NAD(P)/FAD-dependent oxidoreductase n=1 Tax=Alkalibacter rhizosphaerae TaxID=2815577 RepID=UPI001FEF3547|nr:NAD(P)/FAD-dependent oxidoreductase [Alkalibacter rhizosphaerae]
MKKYESILQPIKIGNLWVKNRIESSPAEPFLATKDGLVSEEFIEWHKTMAKGGAGIVTIGDSPINAEYAAESKYVIDLSNNDVCNGLFRLTEVIHRYGAAASIELNLRTHYTPTDMTLEEIAQVKKDFVEAAYRCKMSGFDMIMVHGGHGHLVAQFFSPEYNKRTDHYGADTMENRSRFAMELLDEIRDRIGPDMPIEYRISGHEKHENSVKTEDVIEFVKRIEDKIDLIHVSAGDLYRLETVKYMIQPSYVPRGGNVHLAEQFKKALSIPVTTVGSIDLDMAEDIVAQGKADVVAMIRSFIAEPDLIVKAMKGEGELVRPCIRCSECTNNFPHLYNLPIRCSVNPLTGREAEFKNHPKPEVLKKVVIVGGGPAGLEAARRAAGQGHQVVLFEKDQELGGVLSIAAAGPLKTDVKKYLDWTRNTMKDPKNIQVRLGEEATREKVLAENPDVVIVAVGSEPIVPELPGIHGENVMWAGDVDLGVAKTGDRVIIAGAGLTGCETAYTLAKEGKKVQIIDRMPMKNLYNGVPGLSIGTLMGYLQEEGVELLYETALEEVNSDGAVVRSKDGTITTMPCDSVVLSLGVKPKREVMDQFVKTAEDVRFIGDCNNKSGTILQATYEGFMAAMMI